MYHYCELNLKKKILNNNIPHTHTHWIPICIIGHDELNNIEKKLLWYEFSWESMKKQSWIIVSLLALEFYFLFFFCYSMIQFLGIHQEHFVLIHQNKISHITHTHTHKRTKYSVMRTFDRDILVSFFFVDKNGRHLICEKDFCSSRIF